MRIAQNVSSVDWEASIADVMAALAVVALSVEEYTLPAHPVKVTEAFNRAQAYVADFNGSVEQLKTGLQFLIGAFVDEKLICPPGALWISAKLGLEPRMDFVGVEDKPDKHD